MGTNRLLNKRNPNGKRSRRDIKPFLKRILIVLLLTTILGGITYMFNLLILSIDEYLKKYIEK